jgi:hypothetical protein
VLPSDTSAQDGAAEPATIAAPTNDITSLRLAFRSIVDRLMLEVRCVTEKPDTDATDKRRRRLDNRDNIIIII